MTLHHILKLHPWTINKETNLVVPLTDTGAGDTGTSMDISSVHSWQYDEIVFTEPFESFYNIMMANPPTPLPKSPRIAQHAVLAPISAHNGGIFGELSAETEAKEGEKIDAAKNSVVAELEEWRAKLIDYESQVKQLKQDIEGA